MKTTHLLFALLLAAPCAYCAVDRDAMSEHVREAYHIPGDMSIVLGEPHPSEVPGFDAMDVRISRGDFHQTEKLYLSKDGKHYVLGAFKDLSVSPDQERIAKINLKDSPSRGPIKAPVQVVEYTDFQCPYCQRGYEIMRNRIMSEYPTQVRWIYKSLPLTAIHPWAEPAAAAAECARQQSEAKFWLMHDALFENQRQINASNLDQKLQEYSEKAHLDNKAFQACYDAKTSLPKVRTDLAEAESLGISGTPAFVVNGHQLQGGADYDGLKRTIEEALQGKHGKI